jgi:hypothetical protein
MLLLSAKTFLISRESQFSTARSALSAMLVSIFERNVVNKPYCLGNLTVQVSGLRQGAHLRLRM